MNTKKKWEAAVQQRAAGSNGKVQRTGGCKSCWEVLSRARKNARGVVRGKKFTAPFNKQERSKELRPSEKHGSESLHKFILFKGRASGAYLFQQKILGKGGQEEKGEKNISGVCGWRISCACEKFGIGRKKA